MAEEKRLRNPETDFNDDPYAPKENTTRSEAVPNVDEIRAHNLKDAGETCGGR